MKVEPSLGTTAVVLVKNAKREARNTRLTNALRNLPVHCLHLTWEEEQAPEKEALSYFDLWKLKVL